MMLNRLNNNIRWGESGWAEMPEVDVEGQTEGRISGMRQKFNRVILCSAMAMASVTGGCGEVKKKSDEMPFGMTVYGDLTPGESNHLYVRDDVAMVCGRAAVGLKAIKDIVIFESNDEAHVEIVEQCGKKAKESICSEALCNEFYLDTIYDEYSDRGYQSEIDGKSVFKNRRFVEGGDLARYGIGKEYPPRVIIIEKK